MVNKCFLCDSDNNLTDFNDETFKNCLLKLAFRKKKNFKYNNVELTKASLDVVGYHSACYKKVTVLKNILHEEFKIFCEGKTVSAFYIIIAPPLKLLNIISLLTLLSPMKHQHVWILVCIPKKLLLREKNWRRLA